MNRKRGVVMNWKENIGHKLVQAKIVPVLTIQNENIAGKLADTLALGGITCAEVTFRTKEAPLCLAQMVQAAPKLCVGAGTILNVEQAKNAKQSGAAFIVTPAFNPQVIDYCLEQELPVIPGICTPYEVEQGLRKELSLLKFFPTQACGGTAMLKALAGPYGQVMFMPTGGITMENVCDYLALGNVAACGMSWIAPDRLIDSGDFETILLRCREAVFAAGTIKTKEGK